MRRLSSPQIDNPGMTAVFVTNYEMTLGAVIAINESGIRVPDELSVVGFDNMDLARITHPRLTVVTQPLAEIGARAAQIMLERLGGGPRTTPLSLSLSTTLCEGGSVRDLTAD